MLKFIIKIILLIFLMGWSQTLKPSDDILKKVDAFRVAYESFLVKTQITTYKNGKLKDKAVFDAYIQGEDKSLIIQKEGKNKQMKILYVQEKLYVHLPGTRRPIRITPIQRLMGQASNGDVARVSLAGDYTVENVGEKSIRNVPCQILHLLAKKKSATYHKIILYVRSADFQPVKSEFFLVSGKHFKTAWYDEYMQISGKPILKKMTIVDELREHQETVFEYLSIQQKTIAVKYFNKNYLIHVRGLTP